MIALYSSCSASATANTYSSSLGAVGGDARRRDRGHEQAGGFRAAGRSLEIGDVARQRRLAGIANGSGQRPAGHPGESLMPVVVGVELREFAAVSPSDGHRHAGVRRPVALLEAAHALEHVTRPADRLAEFAVV